MHDCDEQSSISVLLWWHKVKQHSLVVRRRNAGGTDVVDVKSVFVVALMWHKRSKRKMFDSVTGRKVNCKIAPLGVTVQSLNMALLNPPFHTKKIQVKQDCCCGNYYVLLCTGRNEAWRQRVLQGEKGSSYINDLNAIFHLSNTKLTFMWRAQALVLSQAWFWHQTHKMWFVLGSWAAVCVV